MRGVRALSCLASLTRTLHAAALIAASVHTTHVCLYMYTYASRARLCLLSWLMLIYRCVITHVALCWGAPCAHATSHPAHFKDSWMQLAGRNPGKRHVIIAETLKHADPEQRMLRVNILGRQTLFSKNPAVHHALLRQGGWLPKNMMFYRAISMLV